MKWILSLLVLGGFALMGFGCHAEGGIGTDYTNVSTAR